MKPSVCSTTESCLAYRRIVFQPQSDNLCFEANKRIPCSACHIGTAREEYISLTRPRPCDWYECLRDAEEGKRFCTEHGNRSLRYIKHGKSVNRPPGFSQRRYKEGEKRVCIRGHSDAWYIRTDGKMKCRACERFLWDKRYIRKGRKKPELTCKRNHDQVHIKIDWRGWKRCVECDRELAKKRYRKRRRAELTTGVNV